MPKTKIQIQMQTRIFVSISVICRPVQKLSNVDKMSSFSFELEVNRELFRFELNCGYPCTGTRENIIHTKRLIMPYR